MADLDPDEVRTAIRKRYGAKARRAADLITVLDADCDDTSCCGGAADLSVVERLYAGTDVTGLPAGAIEAAAGCGNPGAIAALQPGEVVLDLGSGGGIDCLLAARQVGPAGRVIGVDFTPDMVSLARTNATKVGASNVEFRFGQIEELPVVAESVDTVISNCVINLSTDKDRVFREVLRVLKPGGRLRVSDMVWLADGAEADAKLELWAGCVAGALVVSDYVSRLEAVGFTNVRYETRLVRADAALASASIAADKPRSS